MYPFTTDCNRLIATSSYVACGIRMTRLIHVLCACGLIRGSHGDAVLLDHSGQFSPHLDTSYHENHDDIPWNSVPSRGFRGTALVAKY